MTQPEGPLYVVGGQQKRNAHYRPEWQRHQKGLIVRIDPLNDKAEICVEYQSPPEVCAEEDPAILFKAGTACGDRLFVCTQTEVLVYRLPVFEQCAYLSLPCFNDIHHVAPTGRGTVLVANTGLDMVLETTLAGEVLREWAVLGGDPWARASKTVDYRRIPTTKPHASHPNYVFTIGDDVWVTRFEQRDAICLTRPARHIEIGVGKPHDGIVHDGLVYFTTVNGHIVVADPEACRIVRAVDLNRGMPRDRSLGWCRGLHVIDDQRVVVGFSRLRPTKFIENIQWAQYQLGVRDNVGHLPTRVALVDLADGHVVWERTLEELGMSVVFSIHAAS